MRWDDDGALVGSFRLPPEDAIRLLQALSLAAARLPEPPAQVTAAERTAHEAAEGKFGDASAEAPAARAGRVGAADALLHLADTYLTAAPSNGSDDNAAAGGLPGLGVHRHDLVIHASAEALAKPDNSDDAATDGATLGSASGPEVRVHPSTARRLTCDCTVRTELDSPGHSSGQRDPLHLGRRTRRVNGKLASAVHARDRGHCQAPGCARRTAEIHHIHHWASGGPTCITNLISLCAHHHWLVHEGGWHITTASPDAGWVFHDPEHRRVRSIPPTAATAGPLDDKTAIPADAITGHWDGTTLNLTNTIQALLIDCPNRSRRPIAAGVRG